MVKLKALRMPLQLVASTQTMEDRTIQKHEVGEQLALNFFGVPELLFVKESDILATGVFANLLESVRPHWLFDIRITPRLDFLAPNRSLAFKHFIDMKLDYIDIFGVLGTHSYRTEEARPESWGYYVASVLSEATTKNGPYMFIFDNEEIMKLSENTVPSVLKKETDLTNLKVATFSRNVFV